jgi:rRNA-processing protein FCF1
VVSRHLTTAVDQRYKQDALSEELALLIVDTNILLHHFETLQQFIADVEALSLPVKIVVPGIVICELDGFVILFVDCSCKGD